MKTFNYTTHSKQVLGDMHTPVSIYLKVRDMYPQSALMESSDYHAGENSLSFIALCPLASIGINGGIVTSNYPDNSRTEEPLTKTFHVEKAMKKVAGTLKLIYSQYRELQSFAQFGSDLDADTKARLAQGERIVEVLKQNRSAPVAVEKQVAILYATIHDYLVKVKVADVAEYEKGLYEYLDTDASGAAVMETIRTTGNLDADAEQALKSVLSAYTESFLKAH